MAHRSGDFKLVCSQIRCFFTLRGRQRAYAQRCFPGTFRTYRTLDINTCDIQRDIFHTLYGGYYPWMKEKGVVISCCTDGLRPVVFKLERIEETHPVVYPAAGSHANYFGSAVYLGSSASTGVGCDDTSGEHTDLTSDLPTTFVNEDYDYPVEQKPSWGVAGWADDDEAVLLYDRYDIWSVTSDGTGALRLTEGARDEIRHRLVRLLTDRSVRHRPGVEPLFVNPLIH